MTESGIIFNIQRYTIHDGPGIRTELFLKGCPMHCRWCGNPESQDPAIAAGVYSTKCLGKDKCGFCGPACPSQGSLIFSENKLTAIDRTLCTGCMKCAEQCPADAIKQWGRRMSVDEAMKTIRRDVAYYQSSGGGVTISGGEPLMQSEFTAELLRRCREEKIHTCLESTFCTDWDTVSQAVAYADLLITDLKHMDPDVHRKYTGLSNKIILSNLRKLAELGKELIVRIPVIPGVNDDMGNIKATCDFLLGELGGQVSMLQLLGFMRLGEEKYASLGIPYPMKAVDIERKPFNKHIDELVNYFIGRGINCIAGTTVKEDGGMKR